MVANGTPFVSAQHELAAPDGRLGGCATEADASSPNELFDAVGPEKLLERVDLLGRACELEDDRVRAQVGDAGLEDLAQRHQLGPSCWRGGDLDQGELPLDRVARGEPRDPE